MERVCDIKELQVIDEEMLQKAVEVHGPQGHAGLIAKEGLKYNTVTELYLNYRDILKIEHLWEFTSLTKLQLDNNKIEKIEGLGMLINLEWLDLSFNNIEMIEGLDSLVKLQDLILSNNRISVIENLDALQNLQILSLVNNLISEHDNVEYLRKFKNLRSLALAGNPCCRDENYKVFVAAYLPDLIYLDYRLLDEQTREKAEKQYQYEIEKLKDKDQQDQKAMEAQENLEKELQLHKDAFVEYLNGPHLFDSMYADDAEASKLAQIPGVTTLLESYQAEFVVLCMQVFEAGLTQHTQRQDMVKCFFTCFQEAIADSQQSGAHIVADFEKFRRQVIVKFPEAADHGVVMDRVSGEIRQIWDTLLTLELHLVSQLEHITRCFETNITNMVGEFIQYVQGIFVQVRQLEKEHHEKLIGVAFEAQDTMLKNGLEYVPNDVHMLLLDKDMIVSDVSASHDKHLLKINNREDEILTRINAWKNELMKSIQDNQIKRNRKRLSEIHEYVDYVKEQLEETEQTEETEQPDHQ